MIQLRSYTDARLRSMSTLQIQKAAGKLLNEIALNIADYSICRQLIQELNRIAPFIQAADSIPGICALLNKAENPHQILPIVSAWQDAQHKTFKDNQISIRQNDGHAPRDTSAQERAKQIVVILDNLRSVFNVGSIFRSSECLALQSVYLCGITPTPEHPNLPKTAMGTSAHVPWRYFATTPEAISELKQEGFNIYALETAEGAASVFATGFDFPMALVLGNESLGISPEILALCDQIVDLPVLGWKNSLNVGVAFAVSAYQILFKNEAGS